MNQIPTTKGGGKCLVCPQDKGPCSNVHIDNLWLNPLSFTAHCFPSPRGGWWLLLQRDTLLPGRGLREGRGEQTLFLNCHVPWLPFVTVIFPPLYSKLVSFTYLFFQKKQRRAPEIHVSIKRKSAKTKIKAQNETHTRKGRNFQCMVWGGKGKLNMDELLTCGVGCGVEWVGQEGGILFTQESEVTSFAILCGFLKAFSETKCAS